MTRERQQIICKGIPIRLLTDFSAETLKARREWHNILEVRKGKKQKQKQITIKNTLHSKAFIQIWQKNKKLYRHAKAKRIQRHQTGCTINAKRTFLGKKEKSTIRNKNITKWEVLLVKVNIQ